MSTPKSMTVLAQLRRKLSVYKVPYDEWDQGFKAGLEFAIRVTTKKEQE